MEHNESYSFCSQMVDSELRHITRTLDGEVRHITKTRDDEVRLITRIMKPNESYSFR